MEMAVRVDGLDSETGKRIRELGFIELTETAKDILDANEVELVSLFIRYANQDYGEVDTPLESDLAILSRQGRCVGIYTLRDGRKVQITTVFNTPVTHIGEADEP